MFPYLVWKDQSTFLRPFFEYPPCITRISLARVERPSGALPTTVKDVLENCLNQNVKIFVIPSKTNQTECYIIRNGEDLNDRISECFRRSTTETASNKKTKKTQLDPKPQLPPRLLKQRQQQAAGGGREDENEQRGPSQKEIRLGDRDDRERPHEPPVMYRSNSYDSRGGGGHDERDWNQDRERDRDCDH